MDGTGRVRPCWGMGGSGYAGDEVWGILAVRALLAGDIGTASEMLDRTGPRYRAGFLLRLGLLTPATAVCMAWRLAAKPSG